MSRRYAQCVYERQIESGTVRDVAYLPERFCRVGARIKIDGVPGVWTVTSVGQLRDSQFVEALYKQRKYFEERLK